MSFLLVLAAAVTLVIGLLNTGLGLIYVSIACSVAAGVVLAVAVVRSRPRAELAIAGGPAPLGAAASPGGPPSAGDTGVTVLPRSEPTESVRTLGAAGDADTLDVGAAAGSGYEWPSEASPGAAELAGIAGDTDFPIAEYDDLTVSEIVPLLAELDPDELAIVVVRERAGRNRSSIVGRIDALIGEVGPPPAAKKAAAKKTAAKKAAPAKKAPAKKAPAKKAGKSAKRR